MQDTSNPTTQPTILFRVDHSALLGLSSRSAPGFRLRSRHPQPGETGLPHADRDLHERKRPELFGLGLAVSAGIWGLVGYLLFLAF